MNRPADRKGLVHVYTGDGKGKTTAALGLALRAAGHRKRVCMIMFLKGRYSYGERYSGKMIPGLEISAYGRRHLVKGKPATEDIKEARAAFEHAKRAVAEGGYDIVILDELTHAINLGMIKLSEVKRLIEEKPRGVELVITGRDSPHELIEAADYVTEFVERKHPYRRGVGPRAGIEY
ncbi:cob(I)yrinic acid a,c-diamide adenosyltransferase [Candidatus Bathyarchaeota archaeon]|nr:cob(I)yrinic acid a,c-diamide adenosyltransferase [Candidatus Bathyarchaeota archaeon]